MQEIHRGLISYYHVLTNMSEANIDYLCILPEKAGFQCNRQIVAEMCSQPSSVPDVNYACDLLNLIDNLIAEYKNLEYQHKRTVSLSKH